MFSTFTRLLCRRLPVFLVLSAAVSSFADATIDVAQIDHDRILAAAATALNQAPVTITAYRAKLSDGGPNDFYSNGDYWWPNPNTTNGLPYINRDGQTNPGNFVAHRQVIRQLSDAVAALGAAYKITGDDQYAAKAAELLKVFFLDEKTRMNPNLQYAQAVPGVSPGRGTGIIDTLHIIEIPKAVEAMENSPAFPPEVLSGLKQWFADYVAWMTTSKNGHDEANALNNHAVAFWLQVAVFAQFTGDEKDLAECRRRYTEVFVPKQMANDGSFPRELARTKPYGYSIFQLDNMVTLCQVLSTKENDLWHFTLPDGRSIHQAVGFMYPFLADKSKWPHKPDVMAWDGWPARQPSLLFAGIAFDDSQYLDLWKRLTADPTNEEVRRNIAITQPVLWLKNPGQE
jgi:Alginate lyase